MEFSGRLAAFPIADLLSWAHNDRRSGSLVVRRSGSEKRVFLREGEVVACLSSDPAEFYGQYLLAQGYIDEAGLVRALQHCQRRGTLLGSALEQLGLLPRARVLETLRVHVEDQVCELFLWKSGIFYFTNEHLPDAQVLPEPIRSEALALEGSRRADEHGRIRQLFVHDNIVLSRTAKVPNATTPLERRVLAQVDGERSLVELYNEVRGSWFRFLEAAYHLTVQGGLDIEAVHEPSESGSTELGLADLLLEQVAEERALFFRHHLALPFDAIERYFPVWIKPPAAKDTGRWTDEFRELYRRVDGRTDLATLFGTVPAEERAALMDRLVLQFREGSLALLPTPTDRADRRGGESPVATALPAEAGETKAPAETPWWRGGSRRNAGSV